MTRKSLARDIAKKTGLTLRAAENLIISFGAVVTETLEKGERIVYSNFGTFYTVHYPSKTIYHPRLGAQKTIIMLPTNVAKWMPSGNIKDMVNRGLYDMESPTQHKAQKLEKVLENNGRLKVEPEFHDIPITVSKTIPGAVLPTTKPKAIVTDNRSPITDNKLSKDTPDDIEQYEKENKQKESNNPDPINIYDELLDDGSHELSTINGVIKAHKDEASGPFSRFTGMFKKKDSKTENSGQTAEVLKKPQASNLYPPTDEKVSLAGAGIFSPDSANSASPGAKKIENIKSSITQNGEALTAEDKANPDALPPMPPVEEQNKNLLFDKVDIKYKDLTNVTVPKALLSRVPENIARKYRAVPVLEVDDKIEVAMVDPEDIETKEILKKLLGPNIIIYLATDADVNHVLGQYQGLESEVESAIETAENELKSEEIGGKQKVTATVQSDDAPAARIVASLLKRAIHDKASDIHIEPTEDKVEVRFRVDGILKLKVELPKEIQLAVASRVKILSNLKIDEQRVPQDGRFNITIDGRRVDFRVSSMPIAYGEKIVMRILDKESGVLTLKDLGITGTAQDKLEENLKKSHGMILVTGPTGSGKTTTLYAAIGELYNEGVNIITLEDPIEYQIKGINQSQVNSEIGYTFANGLRSILRQDPDIIMLGEIRDQETAEMAVHAALTGHVLLSTLHTNDASGAVPRMIDMGVEPFLLTSSINVVIGQRLVRKVCENCREEIKLPAEELALVKAEVEKMPEKEKKEFGTKEQKFYKGKGCKMCEESGYKGRVGIYEVLDINEKINELILKRVSAEEISKAAIEDGMLTMLQDGIIKAATGITTMEEVWRATKE